MLKGKEYQNYTVVTERELYDYAGMEESEEEEFREQLWKEQTEFLKKEISGNVIIHFLEDTHYINECYKYSSATEIDEYIEYLAIKDGVNLVRFSNGNLGYIAYYNGCENGFEIIQTEMTSEEFEEVGQDMDWADYVD